MQMEKNKFMREIARNWVLNRKIKEKTKEFELNKKMEREQRLLEKRGAIISQVDLGKKGKSTVTE